MNRKSPITSTAELEALLEINREAMSWLFDAIMRDLDTAEFRSDPRWRNMALCANTINTECFRMGAFLKYFVQLDAQRRLE